MNQGQEDLLALLATDLDSYYEQLMVTYWHQLYTFVLRRVESKADAEDIVLTAFERAYYALKGFPVQRIQTLQIRPWLYKIAMSVYYKYASKSQLPASVSLNALEEESTMLEIVDDEQEQPEMVLENWERRHELEALVDTLPDSYREMVSLFYFDDLSHQEIANILNQRVGTVRVYVHRALRLLRKTLEIQANEVG
jgi:RNA polymerase sigma-70 factor, ECF subfamily